MMGVHQSVPEADSTEAARSLLLYSAKGDLTHVRKMLSTSQYHGTSSVFVLAECTQDYVPSSMLINVTNQYGDTALSIAARGGHVAVVNISSFLWTSIFLINSH